MYVCMQSAYVLRMHACGRDGWEWEWEWERDRTSLAMGKPGRCALRCVALLLLLLLLWLPNDVLRVGFVCFASASLFGLRRAVHR